jgi:hypothetical protein
MPTKETIHRIGKAICIPRPVLQTFQPEEQHQTTQHRPLNADLDDTIESGGIPAENPIGNDRPHRPKTQAEQEFQCPNQISI